MSISLVAAISENRVIGRDGAVPWHLPDDLKHFRRLTTGHTVIMGRRTFESIGGPLPDRRSIVLSRRFDYRPPGVTVVRTIDEAFECAADEAIIFVIGGGDVYALALPFADRMDLTVVHATFEGDTFFPPFDPGRWRVVTDEHHPADDRHAWAFSIRRLERVPEGEILTAAAPAARPAPT